jgi:hydroxyacylglutathione hydrolase
VSKSTPLLSIWADWLLNPNEPILLVLPDENRIDEVVKLFLRCGYTKFAGYLVGGMRAWESAGFDLEETGQMTVHEVNAARPLLQVLDRMFRGLLATR